tara:strand:- start:5852 stop:6487 length:636 start_codon:yes stop_codon:yes gene_type:complete
MNQKTQKKNSLGLNSCFLDLDNPFKLFKIWMKEAKKKEPNDPNALSLATSNKNGVPSVRIVLLKDVNEESFVFYTNLESQKSKEIYENPNASMCFHWKSLLRQVRVSGKISFVANPEADKYFHSRSRGSKIGAWASKQSKVLMNRFELEDRVFDYKKKFSKGKEIPRPSNWSGWMLKPDSIEFWLDKPDRMHERLRYFKVKNKWNKELLYP